MLLCVNVCLCMHVAYDMVNIISLVFSLNENRPGKKGKVCEYSQSENVVAEDTNLTLFTAGS